MASKILSVLGGILGGIAVSVLAVSARTPESTQYPALLQVTAVQGLGFDEESDREEGYLVCLTNAHGFTYRIHAEDGDLDVGDFYACIMDDKGTPQIADDTVVTMHYVRPDLFN